MKAFRRCVSMLLAVVLVLSAIPLTAIDVNAAIWVRDVAVVEGGQTGKITMTGLDYLYAKTNVIITPSNYAMAYVTVYDKDGEITMTKEIMENSEALYYLSAGTMLQIEVVRGKVSVDANYVNGAGKPSVEITPNGLKPTKMAEFNISTATMTVGEELELYLAWADSRYFAEHASDFSGNTTAGVYINNGYGVKNKKVATVDENGVITAVGPGETEVYIAYKFGFTSDRCYTFYTTCAIKVVGDYGIQQAYEDYYAAGNDRYFNIVVPGDENGRTTGFDIQVGDQTYNTGDDYQMMITFPDNYTGDVVISKEGFTPYTLENAHLSAYNWVTLYPEAINTPVIQSVLGRSASDSEWRNLKVRSLSVFEEATEEYVIDVKVDWRGKTGYDVWIQQGQTVVPVENGTTGNVALGTLLSNSGESVILCAMATDGTLVKCQLLINVLTPEKYTQLDFGDNGGLSGEYTGTGDAFQNLPFKLKFSKNVTFEYVIDVDGKLKGTIGISGSAAKATLTYYEDIKETVTRMKVLKGETETVARSDLAAELADRIEENGGTIQTSKTEFAIDMLNLGIMGFVEGKLSGGRIQVDEVGIICTIGGGFTLEHQSVAFVAPHYWNLSVKAQLEVPIKGVRQEETGKLQIALPEMTIKLKIEGSLHLGRKETAKLGDLGVKLEATFSVWISEEGGLSDSVWTLNAKFTPLASVMNYDIPFDGSRWESILDWQLYPYKDPDTSARMISLTDEAKYTLCPRSTGSSGMIFGEGIVEKDAEHFLTVETVASNTYADSTPQIANLGEKELLVWLVDDTARTAENRTCLYYAVYDETTGTWSTPAAVMDNGMADYEPVLRCVDGKAYLAWSKASVLYAEGVTLSQTAEKLDIYFAEFDPQTNTFSAPVNISGENGVYDTDPQIVSTDDGITVVWRQNSENNVFGKTGTNSILAAAMVNGSWNAEILAAELKTISGMTAYEENGELVVCFAADTDEYYDTSEDVELFSIREGVITQVTENSYMDALPTWENGVLYRYENDDLTDGSLVIPGASEGAGYQFVSSEDGSFRAVLYTVSGENMTNNIYASVYDENGWSQSIPVTALENSYISDFSAYYNGTELVIAANCQEVGADMNLGRTRIVKCVKTLDADLAISDAYYIPYTVIEDGVLWGYANVTNNGMNTVDRFTVTVSDHKGTALCVNDWDELLLPGQTKRAKFYCDVADIPADGIVISVSSSRLTDGWANNDQVELTVSMSDVSVENAFGQLDANGATTVTAFVVNRGLVPLSAAELTFRKNGPDGEILGTTTVDAVDPDESVMVKFVTAGVSEYDTVYVCVAERDDENIYANNTDFAVVQPCLNEVVMGDIVEGPEVIEEQPLELDREYYISGGTGNEYTKEYTVTVIPEETGYYRLQMRWTGSGSDPAVTNDTPNLLTRTEYTETVGQETYEIEERIYYLQKGQEYIFTFTCYGLKPVRVQLTKVLEQIVPEQITLDETKVEGYEGDYTYLKVTFSPENSFGCLTFTSSDETVATVNQNGEVQFRHPGTAVITVTVDGTDVSAQCVVTSVARKKTALQAETQYTDLSYNETYTFTPEQDGFYCFELCSAVYDEEWYELQRSDSSISGYINDIYFLEGGKTYNIEDYGEMYIHRYEYFSVDQTAQAVIDEGGTSAFYTFIPKESGAYEIFSTGNGDTYGRLYSKDWELIASNDDDGEGSNFLFRCRVEAGEPYLIRANFWSSSQTGSFEVQARPVRYVTSMDILSLPNKLEYIEGSQAILNYYGMKIRFHWSDGTYTDWTASDFDRYMEGLLVSFNTEQMYTTGEVKVCCDGIETSFYVTLVENPVASIEVIPETVRPCIENLDGYYDSRYNENTEEFEEYFYYSGFAYDEVMVRINYKDGTSKTAAVGDYVNDFRIEYSHNQEEVPWTVGGNNEATVQYIGVETTFMVPVQPNPVESIEVLADSVQPSVEGVDGYYDTWYNDTTGEYEPFFYYYYDSPDLMVKINYKDGTSKIVSANEEVDGYEFYCSTDQYDKPWTAGGENEATLEYMGIETIFLVPVQPNPVASIEVIDGPDRTVYSEYYVPDFTGLTLQINYIDGTSETVTATEENLIVTYDYYEDLCQTVMVGDQPLKLERYWDYDEGAYCCKASYMGRECDLDSVISFTDTRAIASVTVENVTETGAGMVVHVTYEDGGIDALWFDQVVYDDNIPATDICGAEGYAFTPYGLLEYSVLSYLDDDGGEAAQTYVYVLGQEIEVTLPAVQPGDVNNDGMVNPMDVTMLRRHLVGGWNVSIDMKAADLNGDGTVNAKDATLLRRYLVGGWNVELN